MSKITKPLILDETGKAIVDAIKSTDVARERIEEINQAADNKRQEILNSIPDYPEMLNDIEAIKNEIVTDHASETENTRISYELSGEEVWIPTVEELKEVDDKVELIKADLDDVIISNARKADSDFGKNLFNKNSSDNLRSCFYNSLGNVTENTNYGISHYIHVESGKTYSLTNCGTINTNSVVFNGSLEKVLVTSDKTITIPDDGILMRVSFTVAKLDSVQVEKGDLATSFEPYTSNATAEEAKVTAEEAKVTAEEAKVTAEEAKVTAEEAKVTAEEAKVTFFDKIESKNLFNKDDSEAGYYIINQTTGAISENINRFTTGYIPLKSGESVIFTHDFTSSAGITQRAKRTCYSLACYNVNKELLSDTVTSSVSEYTASSEDIAYIRVCFYTNTIDRNIMIEYGTSITDYEPYKIEYRLKEENRNLSFDKLSEKVIKNETDISKILNNNVRAYLPDVIYCAVGRTIEIYNQYVCLNDKFHINWVCDIGKALKRKFSVTGTESLIGDYELTLNICDDDLNVVWSKTATLKIVSAVLSGSHNINPIGDSLTNNKLWEGECQRLSDGKIHYVGTNAFSQSIEGGTYTGGHEGYPGVAGNFFLTQTNGFYTNPYYTDANNVFDVGGYISRNGLSINAIQIMLGTNGIAGYDARISEIKIMIEHIRAWNMTIPIFVVAPIYRGNQNGIGVQINNEGYSVQKGRYEYEYRTYSFEMIEKEDEMVKSLNDSNVHFIPLGLFHDGEYNFGNVATPVNPRCEITESMPTESVHPQPCGQLQMADEMYSTYCGIFG